jgi:hypothetical protein
MTTNTGQWRKRVGTRIPGQDSRDKNSGAGQLEQKPGQDSQDKTARECWDGTARTRKRGQDAQNMTGGQGTWDRKTEMGQLDDIGFDAGQDNPDRSVWIGWPDMSA